MTKAEYEKYLSENLDKFIDLRSVIECAKEEERQKQNIMYIKNGLKEGISLETISDFTRLSIEEIKKIIAKHNLEVK